jgi:protein tyrosine/serine phosphatase
MSINDISNFREISIGKISPGILYRSSHPIYDGNQVEDVVLYANNAKINTVLNLSDNVQALSAKVSCCPWYDNIVRKNNVIALEINENFNIMENNFSQKIKQGISFMLEHEPPYLIHCETGTARTGFLSMILEAFMEAKFDDMVKDYMLSYVDGDEYSKNDYNDGTRVIRNLFGTIKGGLINTDDDLQYLSKIICKACFFVIASANCCSILLQYKELVKCYVLMPTSHY